MKQLEEVENMSLETLETIAGDQSVKIPPTLDGIIADTLTAAALSEKGGTGYRKRTPIARYCIVGSAAAAAAGLAIILTLGNSPRDTFDDPAIAYAQLEKTFSLMSSKINAGIEIASEAKPVIEKTNEAINKINGK
ncbi:MAG: hypothetical protein J5732_00175 [Bacteroidaceae bacterium]|nr:hypothetical protein [Bacteroidaceae bacterium]